jgi:NAD-dependent deacetylase
MCSDIKRVAEALRSSTDILAVTGAGISAESGIPTFRGEGGYWRSYDAAKLATLRAFQEDPKTVWQWYDYRRRMIAEARPNAAHLILAAIERHGKRVFIITQNVDDLHERAGSREVIHIHGSIWEVTCLAERRVYEHRQAPLAQIPPLCHCGGLLRPNVVWFDEELPAGALATIEAYYSRRKPEVLLVIGTEGTFDYIRHFVRQAKDLGALVVEINPAVTAITPLADYALHWPASEALSMLAGEAA